MAKKKRSKSSRSRSSSGRAKNDRPPTAQHTEPEQKPSGGGGCCGGGSAPADVAPSPERSGAPDGWQTASAEEETTSPAATAPGADDAAVGADKASEAASAMPSETPAGGSAASGSGGSNPPEQGESKPKSKPPSKKETFGTFVDSFQPARSLEADGKGGLQERAATRDDLAALVEVSADDADAAELERRRRRSSAAKAAARAPMGDAEAALAAAQGDEAVSRALEKVGVQPITRERRSSASIAHDSSMLANTPLGRRLQAQAEEEARRNSQHTCEE